VVYAGAEDAGGFLKPWMAARRGRNSRALRAAKGSLWQPGAGGMAVHTILLDKNNANRIFFVAISAAGAFRSEGRPVQTWKPN